MLAPTVQFDIAEPIQKSSGVRTSCRIFAMGIVAMQAALIVALILKSAQIPVLILAIFGLVLIGALLIACNQPIGRVIFIPPAVLQILVAGILGLLNVFGVLAGYLSQSGSLTLVSVLYTTGCALSVLYLGAAILLFMFAFRKN